MTLEEWEQSRTRCMFSGLRDVEVGDDAEVGLDNGFSLVRPNEHLLLARDRLSMTGTEFADGASVSRYLVYKHEQPAPGRTFEEIHKDIKAIFQCGLMALQVLKPVRTLGIVFYSDYTSAGKFQRIERRPPMEPGPWALRRSFDQALLEMVPSTIESIQRIMKGPIVLVSRVHDWIGTWGDRIIDMGAKVQGSQANLRRPRRVGKPC